MKDKKINIALAEDHLLVRQGLVHLLNEYEGINVLFDVGNGAELLEKLKKNRPEIILLDIEMPIMSGREALQKIKEKYPKIKVLIISSHFEDSFVIEFITQGAAGFLPKNTDIDIVVDAIYAVKENGFYFDKRVSLIMAQALIDHNKNTHAFEQVELSIRERQVLELLCKDKTTREIAEELCLSSRTVEGYRKILMEKTRSKNSMGLINFAIKNQIIRL